MKRLFYSGLLAFALITGFAVFTGCQTAPAPTAEAVKFNSLKSTWIVALNTYDAYCELAVQREVSAPDQATINKAWNDFREGFTVALKLADNDWTAPTPDDLERLKNDLIIFIRAL